VPERRHPGQVLQRHPLRSAYDERVEGLRSGRVDLVDEHQRAA
jgi:hypothetical protein